MRIVTTFGRSTSRPHNVTMTMIESAAKGRNNPLTRAVSAGKKIYLSCERSKKQHNLGDLWAVDRRRMSFRGRTYQRFVLGDEDLAILKAARRRGCR